MVFAPDWWHTFGIFAHSLSKLTLIALHSRIHLIVSGQIEFIGAQSFNKLSVFYAFVNLHCKFELKKIITHPKFKLCHGNHLLRKFNPADNHPVQLSRLSRNHTLRSCSLTLDTTSQQASQPVRDFSHYQAVVQQNFRILGSSPACQFIRNDN